MLTFFWTLPQYYDELLHTVTLYMCCCSFSKFELRRIKLSPWRCLTRGEAMALRLFASFLLLAGCDTPTMVLWEAWPSCYDTHRKQTTIVIFWALGCKKNMGLTESIGCSILSVGVVAVLGGGAQVDDECSSDGCALRLGLSSMLKLFLQTFIYITDINILMYILYS